MPEITKPVINYTARDFATIRSQLEQFVQATRPTEWTDFFESNLGQTLIELAAYVGDIVSYGQDVLGQEVFLSTARRYESVLRFARSVGYIPRSALSAEVVVVSDVLPQNVVLYGGVIAAQSYVTGTNGLRYEVLEETIVNPGTSTLSLILSEGTTYTEEFTPTRASRQEFVTSRGIVQDASWSVFVGATSDPDNEWTQVANVTFEKSATKTFEVFFDGDGKLHVVFGDSNAGKIPDQTITIIYRVTNGVSGNSALNTISGSFQIDVVTISATAAVAVKNTTTPATGGRDRETVDDLRVSIPSFIRTLDQVRTLVDYEDAVTNLAGVQLVYADVPLSSYQGNIIRVNVWDTEAVNFVATSPETGISSAVTYNRYVQVPTSRIYTVQQYLRPRAYATVHNIVTRPTVAQVDLFLGRIAYDKSKFKATDVHANIVQAVVTLFESGTGFALRISDLYEVVLNVPGVKHFTIARVIFEHIDFDNPPATLIEEFRTDQDSDGSEGGPFLPMQDLLIPGASARKFYDDAYLYDNEVVYDSDVDNPNVQAINLRTLTFDLKT
jgi:hypothetical protein